MHPFLLLLFVVPSVTSTFCPHGFAGSISSQHRQDGQGYQVIGDPNNEICFLTRGAGLGVCKIQVVNGQWRLIASGKKKKLSCGASCLSCVGKQPRKRWTVTNTEKVQMISSDEGFCYLVETSDFQGSDGCKIENDGGYWSLEGQKSRVSFNCQAECSSQTNITSVSEEYLLSGKGGDSQYLSAANDTICFLSNLFDIYDKDESCEVSIDGDYWKLSKQGGSHQGAQCGARCVSMAPTFAQTSGRWHLVQESMGGEVSQTITTGIQTSETKTITKEWSLSFTYAVEVGVEFDKVTMSTTAEHSVAHSISDQVTHIATRSETATCGSRVSMHTWLYQWVVDGYHHKGHTQQPDATVYSMHSRCHYTKASENEMPPQCPVGFCGDELCTAQHCKDWKKQSVEVVHGRRLLRRG